MEIELEGMRLDDQGTRYQHYTELMQMWEDGLEILRKMGKQYKTAEEDKQEMELEIAARFLRKQIEVLSNYYPFVVRDTIDFGSKKENDNNN